jgi:hypothetical protein
MNEPRIHRLPQGARMNLETEPAKPATLATNFLDHLFDAHTTPLGADEKLELIKVVCNALTNQVMWSLISHTNQRKRSEERSLDERNEQDENMRGQTLSNHLTDASGFHVRDEPLKIAAMCDGMRVHAYDQLHAMFEMAEADEVLYTEPAFTATDPRRYRTPMSLGGLLNFWAGLRSEISPDDKKRLDIVKAKFPDQYARAIDDARTKAKREAAKFRETARDVLIEARSFTEAYDFDAYTALPLDIQLGMAERIQDKLLTRAAKLLTNTVMEIEDAISISTAMHGLSEHARTWLNQPKIRAARDVLAAAKTQQQAGRKTLPPPEAPAAGELKDDLPF